MPTCASVSAHNSTGISAHFEAGPGGVTQESLGSSAEAFAVFGPAQGDPRGRPQHRSSAWNSTDATRAFCAPTTRATSRSPGTSRHGSRYSLSGSRAQSPGTTTCRICWAGLAAISTCWHFIGSFSFWSGMLIVAAVSSSEPGSGTTQAL